MPALPKLSEVRHGDAEQRKAVEDVAVPYIEGLDPESKDDERHMTQVLNAARTKLIAELERRRDDAKEPEDRKAIELLLSALGTSLHKGLQSQPQVGLMSMKLTLALIDFVIHEGATLYMGAVAHAATEAGYVAKPDGTGKEQPR